MELSFDDGEDQGEHKQDEIQHTELESSDDERDEEGVREYLVFDDEEESESEDVVRRKLEYESCN